MFNALLGTTITTTYVVFGAGSGPIALSHVGCTGTEARLIDCPSSGPSRCSHYNDVGLRCSVQTGTYIPTYVAIGLSRFHNSLIKIVWKET